MVTGVGSPQAGANMSAPEKKPPADSRRSNKPIMEKRRRARINNCLNELKALILDAMKKDPARHSKLEKADILEMTVKHLEGLRSESAGSPDRFRAGYRHCVSEVSKYQGLEAGLKRRLVRHLEACVNTQGRPAGAPTPPSDNEDVQPPSQHSTIFISGPGSGVRLVPTRLSNGDIALVLPAGVNASTLGTVPTLVPLSPRDASSSSSSEPRCYSPASSGWGTPPPPSDEPAPLALVTRKQPPEDKPWRPW
ncbi:protein hairy-like isoform X2 [Hyposmocoma kahamanoa]|uniref:protein hairy-like isoform X2 n=1 Tax=Hyposmocoma kahamanoa TaxID=1477025 RepID=UPI000E6D611C|nr:protein hairy-like isoform X2 [Hyposmocoma kahamanoa]